MTQDSLDVAAMGWQPLHQSDEMVNIYIPELDRWPVGVTALGTGQALGTHVGMGAGLEVAGGASDNRSSRCGAHGALHTSC
jgi:hypothetical protein